MLAFEAFVYKGKERLLRFYVDLMDGFINNAGGVELLRRPAPTKKTLERNGEKSILSVLKGMAGNGFQRHGW